MSTTSISQPYTKAPYPVIDPHPSFSRVVSNFRANDYQKIIVTTAISMPFGYMAGTARIPQMRRPSMSCATLIGFIGGFCIAYQASALRLLGRNPNDQEVRENFKA